MTLYLREGKNKHGWGLYLNFTDNLQTDAGFPVWLTRIVELMKTKLFSLGLCVNLLHVFACTVVAEGFVAHEWGTFTSVQGADGIQVEWNPLITTELPGFVYNRSKPSGNPRRAITYASKSIFRTLQRMETPVIYFYSGEERTVWMSPLNSRRD